MDEFKQLNDLPNALAMTDTVAARLDGESGSLHQIDDLTLMCIHAGPLQESVSELREARLTA